jgi:hypothetical protein
MNFPLMMELMDDIDRYSTSSIGIPRCWLKRRYSGAFGTFFQLLRYLSASE